MGSFGGHALPGGFFIFFGIWQTWHNIKSYFSNGQRHQSQAFHTTTICGKPRAIESYLIVIFTTIGTTFEILTIDGTSMSYMTHSQHCTMFSMFGILGVLELMSFYRCKMPPFTLHMMGVLAFIIEGLLFLFHVHGRDTLDVKIHMLLIYTTFATVVVLLFEIVHNRVLMWSLARCALVTLQGSWFWQIAFVLYPRKGMAEWDHENHEQLMLLPIYLAGHCIAVFAITWLLWMFAGRVYNSGAQVPLDGRNQYKLLSNCEGDETV